MTAHLTAFQRDLARRLHAKGMSLRDVAREIGCSKSGIDVVLRGQARDAKPDTWVPRDGHLSASDREEILLGLHRRESMSEIARGLGKAPSTVTREVKAQSATSYSWLVATKLLHKPCPLFLGNLSNLRCNHQRNLAGGTHKLRVSIQPSAVQVERPGRVQCRGRDAAPRETVCAVRRRSSS